MHVLIVGAGPGGLTAALTLKRAGIGVRLFERAPKGDLFADVGGAYDLSPHTLEALDTIGVGASVREHAVRFTSLRSYDETGDYIGDLAIPDELDTVSLRRSQLQRELLAGLDDAQITCGAKALGFEQDDDGVTLKLQGEEVRGDVLIAADGVHSTIRDGVIGDGRPHFCECMAAWGRLPYRDEIEGFAPNTAATWVGGGTCFIVGHVDDTIVWSAFWQSEQYARERDANACKAKIAALFAEHPPIVGAVIDAADAADIAEVGIWDREPTDTWCNGRVALIGDAAHPMTPFLGQGANSAIIDGYVLAHHLTRDASIGEAFAAYEARRMPGIEKNVKLARRVCDMMVSGSWLSDLACRLLFGWIPDKLIIRSMIRADRVNDIGDLLAEVGS